MESPRAQCSRLMDLASAGGAAAFGELAGRMQDELFRFALAQLLCRADAAEAVQETLLRAYQRRRRWRKGGDAVAWLYGICLNVVREIRRRRRRDRGAGGEADLLAVAADGEAPAEREELARLADGLAGLPPRQREAVSCRYLRGMSVRQTAAAMGCAEGTVKAAVFAALRNLRAALRETPSR